MTGHNQDPPSSTRSPAELAGPFVVLEFTSFDEFLQSCSSRISAGGIFLETEPRERVSSPLRFELRIRDGFRLLSGDGEVIRVHDPLPSSGEVAGVTVRFSSLDEASQKLLPVVLDHYRQNGIPPLDLEAEVASVEVEVTELDSAEQEPAEVTLDDLWEEFEVVADRQSVALDNVESPAEVASEALLVEAGQFTGETDREGPEEELESAHSSLDEVEEDLEAAEVAAEDEAEVETEAAAEDEAEAETTAAAEDESDLDEEDTTAEEALDLAGVLPTAPGESATLDGNLELLPDDMAEFEAVSSNSWRQIRELWLLLLMALVGILIGLLVYLGYQDGFEWPWSSVSEMGQPASTELLAAYQDEVPEKPEIITEYDFEDPALIATKLRGPTGGQLPAEAATPPVVSRMEAEPETPREQARAQNKPPPLPAADEVLTGVDRITWQESRDQTVLTLWGDGPFDTDQLVVYRLDTGTPRQVVRILGVSRPFSERNLAVGTSHVSAIRTGLHTGNVGQELHVVADLEDPTVRMRRVEPEGSQLHVYFSKL
jgi:hypothetical protein